jgi:hypothetical protein
MLHQSIKKGREGGIKVRKGKGKERKGKEGKGREGMRGGINGRGGRGGEGPDVNMCTEPHLLVFRLYWRI